MIVLAARLEGGEWRMAEGIASTLRRLGFVLSPQKMVGALNRLLAEDSPMFERKPEQYAREVYVYRVTRFGDCQLGNRFPRTRGLRV
jgi:hypothetical protein